MTRWIAWLAALVLGLGTMVLVWVSTAAPFQPEDVQCFARPEPLGTFPAVKPLLHQEQSEFEQQRSAIMSGLGGALAAADKCAYGVCDDADRKRMRGLLKMYLSTRRNIAANLYAKYGDDALDKANRVFETDQEDDLLRALKKLHRAGHLDIAAYRDQRDALALFVLKPSQDFRPCPAAAASATP